MDLQKVDKNSTTCISMTITDTNTTNNNNYYQYLLSAQFIPEPFQMAYAHRLSICVKYLEVFFSAY